MARAISKAVRSAAIKEYVSAGKSLKDVAEKYGINQETLRKYLGNKVRPRGTRYLPDGDFKYPNTKKGYPTIKNTRKVRESKSSPSTPNSNKRWSTVEDEMLRDAVISNMTVRETVELLGRTAPAIYCRKCQLIDVGFIPDPAMRFPVPTGINRIRKEITEEINFDEIEAILEEVETTVDNIQEVVKANETIPTTNIELEQLAQLVKEYGVNITVSVTTSGTEVKMSN